MESWKIKSWLFESNTKRNKQKLSQINIGSEEVQQSIQVIKNIF